MKVNSFVFYIMDQVVLNCHPRDLLVHVYSFTPVIVSATVVNPIIVNVAWQMAEIWFRTKAGVVFGAQIYSCKVTKYS